MWREAKNLLLAFGRRVPTKYIATVTRKPNPGVAGGCAQQTPVTTTLSETGAPGAIDLKQPDTTVALLRLWKAGLATALCAAAFSQPALAQAPPASVLWVDTVNAVLYYEDTSDISSFAADPGTPTPLIPGKDFQWQIGIADIQAVNGEPVMGVHTRVGPNVLLVTSPTPGHAIADVVRNSALQIAFEILKSDGTPIGTIMASGFAGGASPPGSPSNVTAE